jgi:hypothetical protein
MNNLKNILPLLLVTLWFGCEDLEFPDPNAPSTDVATVQTLVTGAEAGMRSSNGLYLREVSSVGRESYYLEPADPRYTGELLRGPLDPGGFLVYSPWAARYSVIANCRILMTQFADDAGASGFAKTIEAYQLSLVLNMQNENGCKIAPYNGLESEFVTKSAGWTEVAALLDAAYTELNSAGSSFSFTLSSGFTGFDTPATFAQFNRALRARVAVYMDDWSVALSALDNSFMDPAGDMSHGVYHVYSSGQGDQNNGMYADPTGSFIRLMAHPSFEADAEAGDPRFSSKVVKRSTEITYDGLTSDLAPTIWTGDFDPVAIIRNEELVLLKAEATIGNGAGDGLTEINVVRAAHGLAEAASGGLAQLLHEKRYSLFLEGHRWVDMRHYGLLGDLPLDRDLDVVFESYPQPETEVPGS